MVTSGGSFAGRQGRAGVCRRCRRPRAPGLARHVSWPTGDRGVWDGIRAPCDPAGYGRLAAAPGLDPVADPPRDVFLAGLSTVSTYGLAWGLVLRHSRGADREAFLDICRMEALVNRLARRIFRAAAHYYRGQSAVETVRLCLGDAGRPMFRSFVSLSSSPVVAARFALDRKGFRGGTKVAVAMDAREARKLGIAPAMYSLASDVLQLRRSAESTGRTFPMGFADELQAHFHGRWPPGSELALVAILATPPLEPAERRQLERTGLPVLDPGILFQKA